MYGIAFIYIYGNLYCFIRIGERYALATEEKKVLKQNHISKSWIKKKDEGAPLSWNRSAVEKDILDTQRGTIWNGSLHIDFFF